MPASLRNQPVFLVHQQGNLVTIKTPVGGGAQPIGFASKAEGEAYLRSKGFKLSLDIPAEILRLNAKAFDTGSEVLYLPNREAIVKLVTDPQNFRGEDFIAGIYPHDPPVLPAGDSQLNRFLRRIGLKK